jgi:hypothetical protein
MMLLHASFLLATISALARSKRPPKEVAHFYVGRSRRRLRRPRSLAKEDAHYYEVRPRR